MKKLFRLNSVMLILLCYSTLTFSQISGVVLDGETNKPLALANVYLKNTQYGTTTDKQGNFNLPSIIDGNYILVISFMGYKKLETPVLIKNSSRHHNHYYLYPAALSMENIVVTANRMPVDIQNVTSDIEIINTTSIEHNYGGNVSDVLQHVNGIYTKDYGARGTIKSASIRGSSSEQVLFLIDGIRINNPQNASIDMSNYLLSSLSRIEIIKGGKSSLYGSDAVGGVINLITPEASFKKEMKLKTKISSGSFGFRSANVNVEKQTTNFFFTMDANRIKGNGKFSFKENGKKLYRENAQFETINIMVKSAYKINKKHKFSVLAFGYDSDKGVPGSLVTPTPHAKTRETQKNLILKSENRYSPVFTQTVNVCFQNNNYTYSDPGLVQGLNKNTFNMTTYGITNENHFITGNSNIVTFGFEWFYNHLKSNTLQKVNRKSFALFVTDQFTHLMNGSVFREFIINPSLRLDKYSLYKPFVNPGFGFVLKNHSFSIRGNINKNSRIPTFNDLYWPEDSFTKGNINVNPERSFSKNLGINIRLNKPIEITLKSTVYEMLYDNLISWQPDATGKWSPANIGKARSRGIEFYAELPIVKNILNCKFVHSFNITRDLHEGTTYGNILIYHPEVQNNATVNLSFKNFFFDLISRYESHRFYTPDNTKWLPSYKVYDIFLRYNFTLSKLGITTSLIINNLSDKKYQEFLHYPIPGRNYRLAVQLTR